MIDHESQYYLDQEWSDYHHPEFYPFIVHGYTEYYIDQPTWCSPDIWSVLYGEWKDFVRTHRYLDIPGTVMSIMQYEITTEIDNEIIGSLDRYMYDAISKPKRKRIKHNK